MVFCEIWQNWPIVPKISHGRMLLLYIFCPFVIFFCLQSSVYYFKEKGYGDHQPSSLKILAPSYEFQGWKGITKATSNPEIATYQGERQFAVKILKADKEISLSSRTQFEFRLLSLWNEMLVNLEVSCCLCLIDLLGPS